MENIPPAFWVYAVGVLSGVVSMAVPCWLAILASRGAYEISACGVHVKASSSRQAQALFLAALEAHNRLQQRAAQSFKARFNSGLDARQPGGGYQPVGDSREIYPEPPHGAVPAGKRPGSVLPSSHVNTTMPPIQPPLKGQPKHDGTEPGKRRPAGDK